MITISLIVLPTPGHSTVTVPAGTTVADLVAQRDLAGREITINHSPIKSAQYGTHTLANGDEVFAVKGVKGATV